MSYEREDQDPHEGPQWQTLALLAALFGALLSGAGILVMLAIKWMA